MQTLLAHPNHPECTGIAAVWCPVHGDCTCPTNDDGSPVEVPRPPPDTPDDLSIIYLWSWPWWERVCDPACPLHGERA
jgi:hypothetical protein